MQCFPGFLLPLLCRCSSPTSDSKIQSDNKQRTGRRAVRQGNESAAGIGDYQPRAAPSSAISGLTRPVCLTKSSAFGPQTSLGNADGPRTRTNRAAFDCQHTQELSEGEKSRRSRFLCFLALWAWPHAALAPAKPRSPAGALWLCGLRRLGRRRLAEPHGRSGSSAHPSR